jgi:peptidyl-prolyl cis-trans isomerase D
MFAAFRRLSKSAIGTAIMVLFLLLILVGFAMQDLSSVMSGNFGMSQGTLVKVGDQSVTEREMSGTMRRVLQQEQRQNPEATYASIAGQFDAILDGLVDERALFAFASDHGFRLSKALVDAEIAKLPGTRGLDGKFSDQSYAAFLQQQQMTDAEVRQLISGAITQRLVLAPAAVDARVPIGVARPYASMLLEQREGQLALVPVDSFRAGLNPSDGDLQSFYAQNRQRYMVPEQRVLKLAKIGPEQVANVTPTDAEIAAYYKANQATYAGSETRVISQAVVQDKRQADGIAARARGGASFAAAAAPAGFAAADVNIGPQSRTQFSGLAGDAVAAQAFAAAKGAVVGPVRSDLGWHVIKIEDIRGASGRTLEQARSEIAELLTANKRKEALTDLITKVEDEIAAGASLTEAAAGSKLSVITTPAINSAGTSRTDAGYRFPAEYTPVLKPAFTMSPEDDPEVITLANDAGYVLVAVDQAIAAAPAPLAEVKDQVREDWIVRKATDRARAIATQIASKVAGGTALEQAVSQAGVALPPVQPVNARRIQLNQANAAAVAPLRMLFALAQGKSRMVADPSGRGFFIVKTNKITPGDASSNPMLIAQTQSEFQQAASDELAQQLLTAMKADQGIKRNEQAIAAAKQRLSGTGQ